MTCAGIGVRFVTKPSSTTRCPTKARRSDALCICAAQGTREKKLDVGADIRRIEDATAPHKELLADDHAVRRQRMMTQLDEAVPALQGRKLDNGYLGEATPSSRRLRSGKSPS